MRLSGHGHRNSGMACIKAVLVAGLLFLVALPLPVFAGVEITPIGNPDAEAPRITAEAAALYSLDLERIVYGKNENKKLSPYSITKILTCYLALENMDPEKTVTASANATRVYENGSTILLKEGEKIKIIDLVYGALLESGNDAAYALGEAVAGSEEAFVEMMNEKAREWGCEDTHFANPHGWQNEDHYTTAGDMCIIAEKCFANETLLKMSGEKTYTIPETNLSDARELTNFMRFVTRRLNGITGGKTGSWSDGDCSIVLEFERDGLRAILVLLGDTKKARASDAAELMRFSNKVTPGFLVSDEGDVVAEAWVKRGERTRTELTVDGRTTAYPVSNNAEDITVEMKVDRISAPVAAGDVAGTYRVFADGRQIAEHRLLIAEDIDTGWLLSSIYISDRQTVIGGAVLAGLLLVVSGIRRRRKSEYHSKH